MAAEHYYNDPHYDDHDHSEISTSEKRLKVTFIIGAVLIAITILWAAYYKLKSYRETVKMKARLGIPKGSKLRRSLFTGNVSNPHRVSKSSEVGATV